MADFVLTAPKGANKKRRIVGRGASSGSGTTAGKGNKGQQSRSGGRTYVGFEGGQMPLYRRIAQRGFSNYPFKKEYACFNLNVIAEKFADGETVNKDSLVAKGMLKSDKCLVKVLGNGELTKKLSICVDKISKSAKEKVEKAGGSVSLVSSDSKDSDKNAEKQ